MREKRDNMLHECAVDLFFSCQTLLIKNHLQPQHSMVLICCSHRSNGKNGMPSGDREGQEILSRPLLGLTRHSKKQVVDCLKGRNETKYKRVGDYR